MKIEPSIADPKNFSVRHKTGRTATLSPFSAPSVQVPQIKEPIKVFSFPNRQQTTLRCDDLFSDDFGILFSNYSATASPMSRTIDEHHRRRIRTVRLRQVTSHALPRRHRSSDPQNDITFVVATTDQIVPIHDLVHRYAAYRT